MKYEYTPSSKIFTNITNPSSKVVNGEVICLIITSPNEGYVTDSMCSKNNWQSYGLTLTKFSGNVDNGMKTNG